MIQSIRKQRRQRGYARCATCQAEFTGKSQRKAEAKWRVHYIETHMANVVDPEVAPEPEES